MSDLIRTLVQDERSLGPNVKMRCARHWSAAEILSPTWFILESCAAGSGYISRLFIPSILEAMAIERALPPPKWVRLTICIGTSTSIPEPTRYEEIDKAYVVGASRIQVFKLTNGLSYMLDAEGTREKSSDAKEMRLIYKRASIR